MINVERLKAIKDLDYEWGQAGDQVPEEYAGRLTMFTDKLPSKQEDLRDAAAQGDIANIQQCVTAICEMLIDIGAHTIADDCTGKISQAASMTAANLEAFVEGVISTVSSLSVDIQMALYGEQDGMVLSSADPEREIIILAVDDNSFFLNTLKSYLQGSRYKLTCVNAGSVALRFIDKHTPDLFILDIDMPEMDGYELAGRIREKGMAAPIIFLTGNASKEYVVKAVKAGAADFIIKPISKEKALEKVAKYVG